VTQNSFNGERFSTVKASTFMAYILIARDRSKHSGSNDDEDGIVDLNHGKVKMQYTRSDVQLTISL
jgi:hypothetical protein